MGFFCVEDAVGGGGSQPLGAIEVEWRVVPGLDHQIAGLDFAGTGLGYVLAVRGAVGHIAGFLCLLNSKAESNTKKGKGRAQITARRTESRTERARHRKNSSNTPKATEKMQTDRTNNSEKHGKQNEKGEGTEKNSSNTRRTTAVTAKARKDECGEKMTKRRNDVQRKGRKRWQGDID